MATTESEKTVEAPPPPEVAAEVPPPEVETVEAPPPEVKSGSACTIDLEYYIPLAEIVLRFLLFASALVAVVVMVTSKQTKGGVSAKFNYSPAFIYFVAALSVAGLYGITTTLSCLYNLLFKPADEFFKQTLSYFIVFDVILVGIVASATGAAGSFSYIGLKGNSHVSWNKICSTYDVFCKHVGSSAFVSLFASVLLVLLVLLSVCSLYKKVPK